MILDMNNVTELVLQNMRSTKLSPGTHPINYKALIECPSVSKKQFLFILGNYMLLVPLNPNM